MVAALLILLGCELLGELLRQAAHLAVPGPVLGMFLLVAWLGLRGRRGAATPPGLKAAADGLIGHMGLLFVPAGVGVIAEFGLLRQQWLPIAAAVLGSTLIGLAVTGLVMHWLTRAPGRRA